MPICCKYHSLLEKCSFYLHDFICVKNYIWIMVQYQENNWSDQMEIITLWPRGYFGEGLTPMHFLFHNENQKGKPVIRMWYSGHTGKWAQVNLYKFLSWTANPSRIVMLNDSLEYRNPTKRLWGIWKRQIANQCTDTEKDQPLLFFMVTYLKVANTPYLASSLLPYNYKKSWENRWGQICWQVTPAERILEGHVPHISGEVLTEKVRAFSGNPAQALAPRTTGRDLLLTSGVGIATSDVCSCVAARI